MQRVSDLEISSQNGLEERDLTLAFQAGDISSYNEIYRRFRPMVDRICRRMLGNYHDAEEASQEAFLRVYQGLPQFNGRYHLRSWVVRIATNTCLDLIRRRARRPQEFEAADEIPNGNGNGNGNGHHNDDPLEVIITESESDEVRRILDLLPPHYRAALILREYEGLSYEEIGQALDLNASQIKFLLHRAKKRFRKTYKGAFGNGFFAHPIWILWWFVFGRRSARQGGAGEMASSLASGTPTAAAHTIVPASAAPVAAVTQAAVPLVEAATPVVQASAPIVQAVAPMVQAVAPVMQAISPLVQAAAPAMHAAPAVASIGSKAVAAVAALAISGAGAVSAVLPRSSQPATPPSQSATAVQAAPASAPSEAPAPAPSSSASASPAPASSPSASPPQSSAPAPSASESPASESSASPSPQASGNASPAAGSGATAAEPSDFSMTFSSDFASASPCGCGQQPTVASEKVDADNKGVNSFSQRVENAAATDASGQAAWPMWLEHSSADGSAHDVTFGLSDDQHEYRYAAEGQRVSRERLHNGTWRYIFSGTYKREPDQTDGVSSVPTQGTYRAEIVFSWRQDRVLNMTFVLQEQS